MFLFFLKHSFLLLLLLLTLAMGCDVSRQHPTSGQQKTQAILGGDIVHQNDANALATVAIYHLYDREPGTIPIYECTGTLIAPQIILTAAHCFSDLNQDTLPSIVTHDLNVIKDEADLQKIRQYRVKQIIIHPNYVPDGRQPKIESPLVDIALVQLETPIAEPFNLAKLPPPHYQLKNNDDILVYGFGFSDPEAEEPAYQLYSAHLKISQVNFNNTHFAMAFIKHTGICYGDSGGPAYHRNKEGELILVGITSYTERKCVGAGYFFKVSNFLEWIQTTSNKKFNYQF